MDMIDGIIVGAAAAAIGTIVAFKVINAKPQGGGEPSQVSQPGNPQAGRPRPLYVIDLPGLPQDAAPLQQTNPITEAAYNLQSTGFEPAFGPSTNQPQVEAVLPQ